MHRVTSSNNFRIWTEEEIVRSRPWDSRLERLRAEANRPRRACKPFVAFESLLKMDELISEWQGLSRDERSYAWTEKRVDKYWLANPTADPAPAMPLKELRRYRHRLESDSIRYFGVPIGDRLHQLIQQPNGVVPEIPIIVSEFPNPVQSQASMGAAYVTGADFGSPAARRQAHCRARPTNSRYWSNENFGIYVRRD
jgi:hypothetical protein